MHAPKKSTYSAVELSKKIEMAALFADGSRLGTHTDELGEGIGFVPQHAHHQKQNQHMRSFAAVLLKKKTLLLKRNKIQLRIFERTIHHPSSEATHASAACGHHCARPHHP